MARLRQYVDPDALMQIACPTCSTTYDVAPDALGASGRSVRCARCRGVWFAVPPADPIAAPAAPAVAATQEDGSDQSPSADHSVAEQAEASGEFEWSLEQTPVDEETAAAETTTGPGAGEDNSSQDAVDAAWSAAEQDTVAEAEAPSLVPALEPDQGPPAEEHVAPEPENIETVAARRAGRQRRRANWKIPWRRLGMPAAMVALAATLAALIVWRSEVVRAVPQTASLFSAVGLSVNLRGLVFENVRTSGELQEGVPVLIVEGTVVNITGKSVEVPRLRFAMRNRAGHEVYAWTSVTGRSILAPGETATFRTRLASPPADGRDVIVRFFNRRDFLAGMR